MTEIDKTVSVAARVELRRLLLTSAQFIAGFTPPDYLVDGLIQKSFVSSMTAPTRSGKTCIAMRIAAHVALGLPMRRRGPCCNVA